MRKGKVSVFPCIGGPLNGLLVTMDYAEAEAPNEYHQYNNASGRRSWVRIKRHRAILVHQSLIEYKPN